MRRCIKCNLPLSNMQVINESPGFIAPGRRSGVFWCNNDDCEHFGVLTIAFTKAKKKARKRC